MNIHDSRITKEDLLLVPCQVIFDNHEMLIGINSQKIISVIEDENLSMLPASYFPFIGIIEHDDQPIPVLDLESVCSHSEGKFKKNGNSLLNPKGESDLFENDYLYKSNKTTSSKKILICQLYFIVIGILVNATYRIELIKNENVLPMPAILGKKFEQKFNAVIRYRNKHMFMIDLEEILNQIGLIDDINIKIPELNKNILSNKNVLIVDDSKVVRSQLKKLLSGYNMNCFEASDGKDGLDKFKSSKDKFDLILVDIEMPHMNGLQMAKKVREINSNVPIIFNSSISNPSLIEEVKSENNYYLIKFQPTEIMKKIEELFLTNRQGSSGDNLC